MALAAMFDATVGAGGLTALAMAHQRKKYVSLVIANNS